MLPPALLRVCGRSLLLAVALTACGARVVVDSVDGGGGSPGDAGVCPALQATSDVTQNCHVYCTIYDCLGCPDTATACESACVTSAPLATSLNAEWPSCLACVIGSVDQIVGQLSCSTSFSVGGQTTFSLTYPLDVCTTCPAP
jgi:hypothetical protein